MAKIEIDYDLQQAVWYWPFGRISTDDSSARVPGIVIGFNGTGQVQVTCVCDHDCNHSPQYLFPRDVAPRDGLSPPYCCERIPAPPPDAPPVTPAEARTRLRDLLVALAEGRSGAGVYTATRPPKLVAVSVPIEIVRALAQEDSP